MASKLSHPKSHFASKSSNSLLVIVALSIVILEPMLQLGCLSASFGLIEAILSSGVSRNAPPLAVIVMREMGRPFKRYHKPKCSLSIGVIFEVSSKCPATTKDSLLASAKRLPKRRLSMLGRSPTKPTSALTTISLWQSESISTMPSSPTKTLSCFTCKTSLASEIATYLGRNASICSFKRVMFFPAHNASTASPNRFAMTSALTPIEPVEPKSTTYANPRRSITMTTTPNR